MKKLALLLAWLAGSLLLLSQPGLQKDHYNIQERPVSETPDLWGGYEGHILNPGNAESLPSFQTAVAGKNTNLNLKEFHDPRNVYSVTFKVDMTGAIADGGVEFNPIIHGIYISGSLTGWAEPGSNADFRLSLDSNNVVDTTIIYSITLDVEEGEHFYKFFLAEDSPTWYLGEWAGDPNRSVIINKPVIIENIWGQITTDFAGGTGVGWNPFLVATPEHLNSVRRYPGAFFLQVADIDLGQAPWHQGKGWQPLGNDESPFNGQYNGNGHAIRNLTINRPYENLIGLFGNVSGGSLANIHLKNVNITGQTLVGSLCGYTFNSQISECSAEGNILASGNWVGGLVGINYYYSMITSSYAAVNVIANGYSIGGLSGTNEYGSDIFNCYATGDVAGLRNVGGLIGFISGSYVDFCYSTGYISAELYTGGLTGRQDGYIYTYASYWNEETSGQNTSSGGNPLNTMQMLHNYSFEDWDFVDTWEINAGKTYPYLKYQIEPESFNYPIIHLSPSGLKATSSSQKISITWNAPSIGNPTGYRLFRDKELLATLDAGVTIYDDTGLENYISHTYYLIAEYGNNESRPSAKIIASAHEGFAGGTGTYEDPYRISSIGELYAVRLYPENYFLQVADIDAAGSAWSEDEGWYPIGSQPGSFRGFYDGGNHTISNLYINRHINIYQGLFGINYGTIMNLKVVDAQIESPMGLVGILVGINYGQIINCYSSGKINSYGTTGRVGGLTGWNAGYIGESGSFAEINSNGPIVGGLSGANSNGAILNSWSEGNISANASAGGLTGINQNWAMIMSSFSNTQITATDKNSGGLTGTNLQGSSIATSYATGDIIGNTCVGGLVGILGEWASVYQCYATGKVSGNELTGGLIGYDENTEYTENTEKSFWNTYTSGQLSSAGGTPKNTREMVKQVTFTEWDFFYRWGIREGQSYPYLLWQNEPGNHNIPDEIPVFYYLTLVASPPVGGNVEGTGSFIPGQVVDIHAIPNPGYHFINWIGHTTFADHPQMESCKVTMPTENIALIAIFEELVGIEEELPFSLNVYPNPATHKLWIEFENVSGGQMLIKLINLLGQEVLKQEVAMHGKVLIDMDVSHLKAGLYLLNISSESGAFTKKIVVGN